MANGSVELVADSIGVVSVVAANVVVGILVDAVTGVVTAGMDVTRVITVADDRAVVDIVDVLVTVDDDGVSVEFGAAEREGCTIDVMPCNRSCE